MRSMITFAAILTLATLSCDGKTTVPPELEPEPASITLSPDSARLYGVADTVRLVAEVLDEDGQVIVGFPVSWASDDASVATVSESGLVRAVEDGRATITATAGSASATASITVILDPDRIALTALYEATGGPDWDHNDGWLTDAPLEGWYGVEVGERGRVIGLRMWGNGLRGTLPPELALLQMLERIEIEFNGLEGAIPPELGSLPNLRRLRLTSNRLAGPIPPELADASELRELSLQRNRLSGPIPPALSRLSQLSTLNLVRNPVSGPVPAELGRLTNLTGLNLTETNLSGELPGSLTAIDGLEELLAGSTDLCAPDDAQFQEWLKGVRTQRVHSCSGAEEGSTAYVIQAVQSREFPVPLVADEEALLRVFVVAPAASGQTIPLVRATFFLEGEEAEMVEIEPDSSTIREELDESSLGFSANAVIPPSLVRPGLEMVVEIDPDGTMDPSLDVARRIPETGRTAVEVREIPLMSMTLIPFLYDADPDSSIFDITDGLTAEDPLLWTIRTLLPVRELDLTVHDPVATNTTSPYSLLGYTGVIRTAERGTGYYMGTIAKDQANRRGTAPYGPAWVSFAAPDSSTMAHELGHNLGLLHAPCGPLTNADPAFPERDGSIGTWGYDLTGGELVPPSTTDLMSYCDPEWISEFFFANMLRYRHEVGSEDGMAPLAAAAPSLLVWGGVDSDGAPFLEPAFVMDVPGALPPSFGAYGLTGVTPDGAELFSVRFDLPGMADGDRSSFFAFAIPARPAWANDLAHITLTGPDGGSYTLDADTNRPAAIVRDPRTGQVRAIHVDLPPAMSRAGAAVQSPATGLEVLFSRGLPDAAAWIR